MCRPRPSPRCNMDHVVEGATAEDALVPISLAQPPLDDTGTRSESTAPPVVGQPESEDVVRSAKASRRWMHVALTDQEGKGQRRRTGMLERELAGRRP
jgi:hypothetical protein